MSNQLGKVMPAENREPTELYQHLRNLNTTQCHLRNLIRAMEALISDVDEMSEVRTILDAAHKYVDDVWECAEGIEAGLNADQLWKIKENR